jgi:hypothetical protein
MIADKNGGRKFSNVGPSHPPRKNVAVIAHMLNIFIYSAKKNIANLNPEYSVWKPPTSSCSASTRSKGALFTSATAAIKNIPKATNCGNTFHLGMKETIEFNIGIELDKFPD